MTNPNNKGKGGNRVCSIPETGFLRLWQIVGKPATDDTPAIPGLIPISRSSWWAGVKSGRYPQAIRLGERCTVWRVEDVLALIESAASAKADA